jgi:hypothetical protein
MDAVLIDSINSSARTIGLVASGLWIAYTFRKLQKTREAEVLIQKSLAETEKARADSEKALADARKSAAEREELNRVQLSQQPNLDVEFSEIFDITPPGWTHTRNLDRRHPKSRVAQHATRLRRKRSHSGQARPERRAHASDAIRKTSHADPNAPSRIDVIRH